ncbi:MAG: ABC transporter substrate-binding protein [Propionibacteriaceae bacterium]|nr:ABC transporter substrate-binding protein [Propionibacteriaceae bacterium]
MKRRSLFTLTGLGLLGTAGLGACGQQNTSDGASSPAGSPSMIDALRVHVPTTLAFMAPMASFGSLGKLDGLVGPVDVQNWASVDVLRSLLINNETDLAASPSYASANLFNKGVPVRLVAITVWGMLYVLGPEGTEAAGIDSLKGKTVGVPVPNNTPDLVFRYLLKQKGISAEGGADGVEIASYNQADELASVLQAGQVDYAVLPEHAATAVQAKAKQAGKTLERTVNLQEVWAEVTGGQPRFPMAGVVMPAALADANPALVGGVLNELEASVEKVNALDPEALAKITAATEVPEPVVTGVIPRLQLTVVPAAQARQELEDFYTRLTELNPDIVGGKMPDDTFYLADPR